VRHRLYRCAAARPENKLQNRDPLQALAPGGCDPRKVLVGAAEVIEWHMRMQERGIHAEDARIKWPRLMQFKRSLIDDISTHREESFSKSGIATLQGRAHFVASAAIQVGNDVLEAANVVVAAGSRPADLMIAGPEYAVTSEQFLELEKLPTRILFIGGDYVSFEFAYVAARAAVVATILHRGRRPLERFDPDLVDRPIRRTRDLGVDVQLGPKVTSVNQDPTGFKVHARSETGDHEFTTGMVVHSAGRVPEIDDLHLAEAGIDWDPQRGVKNEYLPDVSNPAVYAAGDAAASLGPPLTPVASYEGKIVAENLLQGHQKPSYEGVPSVMFNVPPLASVGLQEQAARKLSLKFGVNQGDTSCWYFSRRVAEFFSVQVLVEELSGLLFGAHLLRSDAGETINLFALAIRKGLTSRELKDCVFAYPTPGSDVVYMV